MEAALSGHEQSSFPNPFLSNHYLTAEMGLAVTLLHEWQISLAAEKKTKKYSQEVVSIWKAMVGSADGSASMWLLDVAFLDRMDVTSLSGERRKGSVEAPGFVPTERSAKPAATKTTLRVQFTHAETLKSGNFSALGKQKMCIRAQRWWPWTCNQ